MIQRPFTRVLLSSLLFVLSGGCALPMMLPIAVPPGRVELKTDIPFSEPAGEVLKLDMARPATGKGPFPAVVCIYGGGWVSGNRHTMRPWIDYLAACGYVAVAPTYRLAPKHPFPAAVADMRNCVRWLRLHAREYNIDPDHIGAMGLSAGGHLSLMLGLTGNDDRFGPDDVSRSGESATVQAVVNYFGPADLVSKNWSDLVSREFLIPFLGADKTKRVENGRLASPLSYVSKGDAPILTFQGDADPLVPVSQACELHGRLCEAGLSNELQILRRQSHGWGDPHLTRTRQDMVRFFDRYLKGIVTHPTLATTSAPSPN
jgi:acetyl esterase/lipase